MTKNTFLLILPFITICLISCSETTDYTGRKCINKLGAETGIYKIKAEDIYKCSSTIYHSNGTITFEFLIKKDSFYINQIKTEYPISIAENSERRYFATYVTPKEQLRIESHKKNKEDSSQNNKLLIKHIYYAH